MRISDLSSGVCSSDLLCAVCDKELSLTRLLGGHFTMHRLRGEVGEAGVEDHLRDYQRGPCPVEGCVKTLSSPVSNKSRPRQHKVHAIPGAIVIKPRGRPRGATGRAGPTQALPVPAKGRATSGSADSDGQVEVTKKKKRTRKAKVEVEAEAADRKSTRQNSSH